MLAQHLEQNYWQLWMRLAGGSSRCIYRAMRAATTAPRTPATGPVASLSDVVLGVEEVWEPPPPTKAVEVRVTTEREPETVLLETPPIGLAVGMEAPPEAADVWAAEEVSAAEELWAALVVASEVASAEVEAGADESAAEVAAEEAAEEEEPAMALQAAAAADWALARSEALHFSIRHGATRPASWAWVDVLHWQAVSVRAQPALGMASLRQGIWRSVVLLVSAFQKGWQQEEEHLFLHLNLQRSQAGR